MEIKSMKMSLVNVAVAASILILSSAAMAGGANCDSMKGHGGKDMSAEMIKQFKEDHTWLFADEAASEGKTSDHGSVVEEPVNSQTKSELVEI
jgi:hypothetical protein